MTYRFDHNCTWVHIELQRECFLTRDQLVEETEYLPDSRRYWLREIMLLDGNQT